jgi:periplasmic divalent cation tolerance protein
MNAMNTDIVLVYTTFPTLASAEEAGRAVVEARLAACVNILPGMVSWYEWQGRLERGEEVVMIVKTRGALAESAMAAVRARHPYEEPALLVLPVAGGSESYCAWILAQTEAGGAGG